jgi:hypothetical protein
MIQEFCDFCRRPTLHCSCPKPFIILSNALFDLEQDKTAAENQQAAETVRHAIADLILEHECDGRRASRPNE